jgi:hypothetical protein
MKPFTPNTGDVFEIGQIWESPRGFLYHVVEYESAPSKGKRAVLRLGGTGRKVRRDWDAVIGWVINTHKDGTPAGPGVHC